MTADEFTAAAIALLRTTVGWQSKIARRLGIESRTVRRWLHDGAIPLWAEARLKELMGGTAPVPFPRDEWVLGDGVSAAGQHREYIVHTAPPRFVARVVECDPDGEPRPDEVPADVLSGVVYVADATDAEEIGSMVLCEIDWIDEPAAGEITGLLEAASDAIETMILRDGEPNR